MIVRCRHCGWPVKFDEKCSLWTHVSHDELNRYFCWDSADYKDPDYAEPQEKKENVG